MKIKMILITLIITVAGLPGNVNATGSNFNTIYGARTLSLNGLYIAGSDGLHSSFINPAGLAFLRGKGFEISFIDRIEQNQFSNTRSELYRSFRDDNINFNGGLYFNISNSVTAAFSYNRVTNYNVNWPYAVYRKKDSLTAIAAYDMSNQINADVIVPSIAMKFGRIAVGLSVDIYYVQMQTAFPQGNPSWYKGQGLFAYQFNYDLNAWTYGLTLGVNTDISNDITLGGFIKTGYKANLKGNANSLMFNALDKTSRTQVDLSADLETPISFGLGFIYKLTPHMNLNVDAAFNLWGSTQSSINFLYSNSNWQNRLATTDSVTGINASSFKAAFTNALDAGFGLEYKVKEGLYYRFGYRFNGSPNSDETYSFLFPNVDQHWLSAGLRYTEESFYVDFALAYSFGQEREVKKMANNVLSGLYNANSLLPLITLHYSL